MSEVEGKCERDTVLDVPIEVKHWLLFYKMRSGKVGCSSPSPPRLVFQKSQEVGTLIPLVLGVTSSKALDTRARLVLDVKVGAPAMHP